MTATHHKREPHFELEKTEEQVMEEVAATMEATLATIHELNSDVVQDDKPPIRRLADSSNLIAESRDYASYFFEQIDERETRLQTQIAAAREAHQNRCGDVNQAFADAVEAARQVHDMELSKLDVDLETMTKVIESELFEVQTVREGMKLFNAHLVKAKLPKK